MGFIDLLPSDLNNNSPSIDYCVLSDEIKRGPTRSNPAKIFYYPFKESTKQYSHKDLLNTLFESTFAVVKAGTIAYEAIHSGCYTYVYGTNKWEWIRACELVDKGLAKFYCEDTILEPFESNVSTSMV